MSYKKCHSPRGTNGVIVLRIYIALFSEEGKATSFLELLEKLSGIVVLFLIHLCPSHLGFKSEVSKL